MNGFEPLRRRIIDYTAAGQWQEIYDGPIEECEEYRLKFENFKLRKLVRIMHSELVSYEDNGYVCGGHKFDGRVRELGVV